MKATHCLVDDCDAKVIARGLCLRHYQRQRRGQVLVPPKREKVTVSLRVLLEADLGAWLREMASAAGLPVSVVARSIIRSAMSRET